ncbi:hypothetical protein SUGI_1178880 [Cryptomeria japonica]|nr:hypothetical protein SUGI_1178880 [Cryptomeria japonica]
MRTICRPTVLREAVRQDGPKGVWSLDAHEFHTFQVLPPQLPCICTKVLMIFRVLARVWQPWGLLTLCNNHGRTRKYLKALKT